MPSQQCIRAPRRQRYRVSETCMSELIRGLLLGNEDLQLKQYNRSQYTACFEDSDQARGMIHTHVVSCAGCMQVRWCGTGGKKRPVQTNNEMSGRTFPDRTMSKADERTCAALLC